MKKKRVALLLVCLALCLGGCGKEKRTYKNAEELLEESSFAQAEELFSTLGDFDDAAEKTRECKYQLAILCAEADEPDYAEAVRLFAEIGAYKDAIARKTALQEQFFFKEYGYRIPGMECVVSDAHPSEKSGKDQIGSFHRYTYTWRISDNNDARERSDQFIKWLAYLDGVVGVKTEQYLNGAYFLCVDGERLGIVSSQKSDDSVGVTVDLYDAPMEP